MVVIEMTASHVSSPRGEAFRIMYEPSPSSNPAKYAASTGSIHQLYYGAAAKPSYFKVAAENLRRAEYAADLPSLFDAADVPA